MYIKDTCLRPPSHLYTWLLLCFTFHMALSYSACYGCVPSRRILCHPGIFLLPSVNIKPYFQYQTEGIFPSDPDLLPFVGMVLSIPLTWASPWRPHFTQTNKEMAPLTYCAEPSDLNFSNRNVLRMVSQAFRIQGPTFLSERTPKVTYILSPWRF